jgi:hypothetical protein
VPYTLIASISVSGWMVVITISLGFGFSTSSTTAAVSIMDASLPLAVLWTTAAVSATCGRGKAMG